MNLKSKISDGPRYLKMYATRLEKLGIFTIEDFLLYIPSRYDDFSLISKISEIQPGEIVTVHGKITELKNQYLRGGRIKTIQRGIVEDTDGKIDLVWFNQPFLIKNLPIGSLISVSGKAELSKKGISLKSPKYEILNEGQGVSLHTGRLIPIYPETKGVTSKWLRRHVYNLLEQNAHELLEYLPENLISQNDFLLYPEAVRQVHFPASLGQAAKARTRLAFDELLLLQLASFQRKTAWKKQKKGYKFIVKEHKEQIEKLINSLPFKLTTSQNRAVEEILKDLASNMPMNRLLQGDVGSGKTVVASIAMYTAHLNGFQSVLMAPTEILANQHFKTISHLFLELGIKVGLATGSQKIMTDKSDILIGTHAVLSGKIKFAKLGLVIIDEQQRFGVMQRGLIREKGINPHLLTMTATPIPRTVALTMYGDLDLSYLHDMPLGRKIVKTWLVPVEKRENAYEWIRKQIKETDSQAFIICPFIEESESMQTIKAASVEFERLRKDVYPDLRMGLLHGKLKSKGKSEILHKFGTGEFDILVATPVVEVGIDIPNATVIMIEASERFGLAQLHQLRGRVGRGDKQSYCLLFTDNTNAQTSMRLKGMETLYSGAELAELDLKLRGPGNMYGTAQHGIPRLKAATFSDINLIQKSKVAAEKLLPILNDYPILKEKVESITLEKVSPD